MDYITEAMAEVGCGINDTKEVKETCDNLTKTERDIIDMWHNLGHNTRVRPELQPLAEKLQEMFTDDDLIVLGTYIDTKRKLEEY